MHLFISFLVQNLFLLINQCHVLSCTLHQRLRMIMMARVPAMMLHAQLMQAHIYTTHTLLLALATKIMHGINRIAQQLVIIDSRHPQTIITYMAVLLVCATVSVVSADDLVL